MAFLDFIKKHTVGCFAILVGLGALGFSAGSWIGYNAQYDAETEQIEADREALNAKKPRLPESVILDNGYFTYDDTAKTVTGSKSSYKNTLVCEAEDATITLNDSASPASYAKVEDTEWNCITGLAKKGGTVTFSIETKSYGKGDIDVVLASTWKDSKGTMHAVSNVSDYIKIEINGLLVLTEEAELPEDGSYQHIILKDTHLIEGVNTLKIKTAVYNNLGGSDIYVMPNIRNIAVSANVDVAIPQAEAE